MTKKREVNISETIDDTVEKFIKQDNPQSTAVKHLVDVGEKKKDKLGSDVELKTDLDSDQIREHSKVALMARCVGMSAEQFSEADIMGDFLEIIERKSISKNRESRKEIVAVARNPDTNITEGNMKQSFWKRFFSPKPQQ